MTNKDTRPHWSEPIAKTESGENVRFNDQMNKFIDDMLDSTTGGGTGLKYDGGSLGSVNNAYLDFGTLS